MKIVMWVNGEANQMALANKIHSLFPLAGLVIENRATRKKLTISRLYEKILELILLPEISRAWFGMLAYYKAKYPEYPVVTRISVSDINSKQTKVFSESIKPDVILVSGTGLVKRDLLGLRPRLGIVNLHTGLSPYINGGPNCTNWCISTNQFHLIGNTMMWINEGIDTGNIIASEMTSFEGKEDLSQIHIRVMEHAHDLCFRVISFLASGGNSEVPQSEVGKGTTYYSRQWGLRQKQALMRNLKRFHHRNNSTEIINLRKQVHTISITGDGSLSI